MKKMKRGNFIHRIQGKITLGMMGVLGFGLFSSCNFTEIKSSSKNKSVFTNDGTFDGKAFIYRDSPYIIAGPKYSPNNLRMSTIIDDEVPELVTLNSSLTADCQMDFFSGAFSAEVSNCVRVFENKDNIQLLPRNTDRTWIFETGSAEFYQVNTLYHINQALESFFDKLSFTYNRVHSLGPSIPRSTPPYLHQTEMFWFRGVTNMDSKYFRNGYINTYSQCDLENNASFSPVGPELCFGFSSEYDKLFMAQDPTVIYHELGHAFVSLLMNLRNATLNGTHTFRSSLGTFGYDEAAAINEGIADYFSFMINQRTHFGEWGLGVGASQSRPMSEDDPLHISAVDTTSEGRLSYPNYVVYDPNFPDSPLESVHYAGQIASHYFVALTKEFKKQCSLSSDSDEAHVEATSYVFLLLAETMSELGDLNAKAIDDYFFSTPFNDNVYFSNLDSENSFLWAHIVNPPTFRRFFQIFAKNLNKFISDSSLGLCKQFSRNESEKLLDDYGLLLFKTYNNNGNSTKDRTITYNDAVDSIPEQTLTSVNENNRRKSVLISKELLSLDARSNDRPDAVSYFVIDNRSDMEGLLQGLLFKGLSIPFSTDTASIDYNNSNLRISPGEIVAVIPNLFNGSNSTMAGVQILATDWDHVDITDLDTGNFTPCLVDDVTTVDEGATEGGTCASASYPDKEYVRLIKDTSTGKFPSNAVAPVCMVLLEDEEEGSSRWVSQNEFRTKQGLSLVDKDCLGYQASGTTDEDFTFNPHECLVRFLPGANDATFSQIYSQNDYHTSTVKDSETKSFGAGNLLLLEVNKWIPPGTKFRCRLRARFSNCSDCFHDPDNNNDDYLDSDYLGYKPFKVINFEFDIND